MTEEPSAPRRARDRVRAAISEEILDAGRVELADQGAAALSLRAVARRLGMAPSALYRYFPSRDSLLTALIIEAYEELGARADQADRAAAAGRAMDRWLAVCARVRSWAVENPRRWALLYGSPVPGYAAPEATVEPATAVVRVVCGIVLAGGGRTGAGTGPPFPPPPDGLDAAVAPIREALLPGCRPEVVVGALMAWTSLVGAVSLDLFGHLKGGTNDFDAVFTYSMEVAGGLAGLA